MSVKNTKININIPKYDVEGQMNFLIQLCNDCGFDVKTLITLIFADWIYHFEVSYNNSSGDYKKSFYSFLATCEKTSANLRDLKSAMEKVFENEVKNENK